MLKALQNKCKQIVEARMAYNEGLVQIVADFSPIEELAFWQDISPVIAFFLKHLNAQKEELNIATSFCDDIKATINTYNNLLKDIIEQLDENKDHVGERILFCLVRTRAEAEATKGEDDFNLDLLENFSRINKLKLNSKDKQTFKDIYFEYMHMLEVCNHLESYLEQHYPALYHLYITDISFKTSEFKQDKSRAGLYHVGEKTLKKFLALSEKVIDLYDTYKKDLNKALADKIETVLNNTTALLVTIGKPTSDNGIKRLLDILNNINEADKLHKSLKDINATLLQIHQRQIANDYIQDVIKANQKSKARRKPKAQKPPKPSVSTTLAQKQPEEEKFPVIVESSPKVVDLSHLSIDDPILLPVSIDDKPKCYTPQLQQSQEKLNQNVKLHLQKIIEANKDSIKHLFEGKIHKVFTFKELVKLIEALGGRVENKSGSVRRLTLPSPYSDTVAACDTIEFEQKEANLTVHAPHNGKKQKEKISTSFAQHFKNLLQKAGFNPEVLWQEENSSAPRRMMD